MAGAYAVGQAVRARPGIVKHHQLHRVPARHERMGEMDQRALHPAAVELMQEEGD
jgi:hypothetical protein